VSGRTLLHRRPTNSRECGQNRLRTARRLSFCCPKSQVDAHPIRPASITTEACGPAVPLQKVDGRSRADYADAPKTIAANNME